jgi:hypothetical protein
MRRIAILDTFGAGGTTCIGGRVTDGPSSELIYPITNILTRRGTRQCLCVTLTPSLNSDGCDKNA